MTLLTTFLALAGLHNESLAGPVADDWRPYRWPDRVTVWPRSGDPAARLSSPTAGDARARGGAIIVSWPTSGLTKRYDQSKRVTWP